MGTFLTTSILAVVFALTSAWGYAAAENKKSENYDIILAKADETQEFYDAIRTDPTRTEAYLALNEHLISNYTLSREEGGDLLKLQTGFDEKNNMGFTKTVKVLDELKSQNKKGYDEVCFELGWSFLSYYEADTDRDRYAYAAKWFKEIKDNEDDNGAIAAIFFDISECTTKINQLRGSKVIQTKELNAQRENLWNMIKDMKTKAENYADDYKLQVWTEINSLINNNIGDFLEVSTPEEMISILNDINTNVDRIGGTNPDIVDLTKELKQVTTQTIARIETAK